MTLSAITRDQRVFNPSALISAGKAEEEVVRSMRRLTAMGLYCPHCFRQTGELMQVKFRNPQERRKHFFHADGLGEKSECTSFRRETERHLMAKAQLVEALSRETHVRGIVEVGQEIPLKDGQDNRRPDVLVTYLNGAKEAHEVQVSYINSDALKTRTDALKRLGCDRVHWYLYGKNYNKENRLILELIGAVCYKLEFDDEVAKWTLDSGYKEKSKAKPSGSGVDGCKEKKDYSHAREWIERLEAQKQPAQPRVSQKTMAEVEKLQFMGLATWYLNCNELPSTPFRIEPHRLCKDGFYDRFTEDVKDTLDGLNKGSSKPHPRYVTGALTEDLKRLQRLVEGA